MPPKNKFTKEQILDAAFNIVNEEGFDSITIRKVAYKLGASIAPIYVNFKNLDDLKYALGEKITHFTTDIMLSVKTHDPFLDIGAGSIKLVIDYTQLYRDHYLNPKCRKYINYNSTHQNKLLEKMSTSQKVKDLSAEQMSDILGIMAHVTYGVIFEYLISKNRRSYDELIQYLEDVADDVIVGYKQRKGVK